MAGFKFLATVCGASEKALAQSWPTKHAHADAGLLVDEISYDN